MTDIIDIKDLAPDEARRLCLEILGKLPAAEGELDPNESDPTTLWAEIWRLRSEVEGPRGFASWKDAAVDERVKRLKAENALESLRALIKHEIGHVERESSEISAFGSKMKITAIPIRRLRELLHYTNTVGCSCGVPDGAAHSETCPVTQLSRAAFAASGENAQGLEQVTEALSLTPFDPAQIQRSCLKVLTDYVNQALDESLPLNTLWRHRKGAHYTLRGVTSIPEPGKAEKFPRTVFYQGADGRFWTRSLESWLKSFTYVTPASTFSPPGAGKLKKGDMRVIDGVTWHCTDPEIDRWVSQSDL